MEETKKTHNELLAEALADTLRTFAEHPERLDSFENYLSAHFSEWFKKYAHTPEDLVYEFQSFAQFD